MKSSETYINRQAPPKVAFVPNWSDLSLGCQFMLHMTHVPKAPPLPHMVPKTGTRKQTVPPQAGLLTQSSHLLPSDTAGQAPALLWRTSNSMRADWEPSKPCGRKGPGGHSKAHCHSLDLERKTSELLIELMSQTHRENQSPSAVSFPLSWAKVENPFDSLLSLLWPFSLLQKLPGTSCRSRLLACRSGNSPWRRNPRGPSGLFIQSFCLCKWWMTQQWPPLCKPQATSPAVPLAAAPPLLSSWAPASFLL